MRVKKVRRIVIVSMMLLIALVISPYTDHRAAQDVSIPDVGGIPGAEKLPWWILQLGSLDRTCVEDILKKAAPSVLDDEDCEKCLDAVFSGGYSYFPCFACRDAFLEIMSQALVDAYQKCAQTGSAGGALAISGLGPSDRTGLLVAGESFSVYCWVRNNYHRTDSIIYTSIYVQVIFTIYDASNNQVWYKDAGEGLFEEGDEGDFSGKCERLSEGEYRLEAKAKNFLHSLESTAKMDFTVHPNQPPTISISDQEAQVGVTTTITATVETPHTYLKEASWDFDGDGTYEKECVHPEEWRQTTCTKERNEEGTYVLKASQVFSLVGATTAKLRVVDSAGDVSTASCTITVTEPPSAISPTTMTLGTSTQFEITAKEAELCRLLIWEPGSSTDGSPDIVLTMSQDENTDRWYTAFTPTIVAGTWKMKATGEYPGGGRRAVR